MLIKIAFMIQLKDAIQSQPNYFYLNVFLTVSDIMTTEEMREIIDTLLPSYLVQSGWEKARSWLLERSNGSAERPVVHLQSLIEGKWAKPEKRAYSQCLDEEWSYVMRLIYTRVEGVNPNRTYDPAAVSYKRHILVANEITNTSG